MQSVRPFEKPDAPTRRGRGTALLAGLVALLGVALLCAYALAIADLTDPSGHRLGRDFLNLHVGGTLLAEGRTAILFDGAAYLAAMREIVGDPHYPVHNWSYPPLLFPLAEAVAALPYTLALALWQAGGLAAVVAAARLLRLGWRWGLAVAFSPAGVLAILTGQNGLFVAALMVSAVALGQARRPIAAGLAWAVLAAKPHLGLCVLPMLLVQRRFGILAAGAGFLTAAIVLTAAVYGPEAWLGFLGVTTVQQRVVAEEWTGLLLILMPTFFIQGRLIGLDPGGAYALHAAGALLALVLLIRAAPRRDAAVADWLLWLVLGTFLLPYSFLYDLVVFQIVLALWHRDPGRLFAVAEGRAAALLWALGWVMPAVGIAAAAGFRIQPVPFFLLFLLWRRAVARRRATASPD